MEARRARRREKKKQRMARQENIPCIVFLATDEESFELAEKKEDRQLRYIQSICRCTWVDSYEDRA